MRQNASKCALLARLLKHQAVENKVDRSANTRSRKNEKTCENLDRKESTYDTRNIEDSPKEAAQCKPKRQRVRGVTKLYRACEKILRTDGDLVRSFCRMESNEMVPVRDLRRDRRFSGPIRPAPLGITHVG